MKGLSNLKKFIYAFICLFSITGCMQNADDKLNKGVELYSNGETTKAKTYIEDGLINSALIKKLDANHYSYAENVIFYRQKKTLKIVWPLELNIEISEDYNIISYDPDSKKLGLCNEFDIKIYASNGSLIKTCRPTPDEQRIKIFTIYNEKIFYYKEKNIYFYDLASDAIKSITNDKFTNSFGKEIYNVKFYKSENLLAIVSGIAGRFYLNVLDLKNNSIVLQNINLASSKLFFKENEIYFVSGDAGKYFLVKQTILPKKTKNLFELSNLTDIEFFSSGLLYEDKDGFRVIDYEKAFNQKIPFHYGLAGQCSGRPVLKYSNKYYIIDMAVFLDKIANIKNKIPSIFEETINK
jgi:hypothetical protein